MQLPSTQQARSKEEEQQRPHQSIMSDFKIQRRVSLSQEVDGIWSGLEEEEDTVMPQKVTMNECHMLRRVLGDTKSEILPKACKMLATSRSNKLGFFSDSPDIGKSTHKSAVTLRLHIS